MICPRCHNNLETKTSGDITTHSCANCSGTWMSSTSLGKFFAKYKVASDMEETFAEILELDFSDSSLLCPSCKNRKLKEIHIDDIELDYCISCKGLFFDKGEMESVFPASRKKGKNISAMKNVSTRSMFGSFLLWFKGDT